MSPLRSALRRIFMRETPENRALRMELPTKRGENLIPRRDALAVCRYDQEALDIIQSSTYTTHNRVGLHRHVRVANAINDFFSSVDQFRNRVLLEVGPGHYSFAMIARSLGAEVVCIERNPIHAQLGRHLGFRVLEVDFAELNASDLGTRVDGTWIKGLSNPAGDPTKARALAAVVAGLATEDAWGWCVTVNKEATSDAVETRIEVECDSFRQNGWQATPILESDRKRYGVNYSGCRYYFTTGGCQPPE